MELPPDVLQFLARQSLSICPRVREQAHGRHPTTSRARGRDFAEFRPYAVGDEPREIDWRATARLERVMIRQTEGERRLNLSVALDAGGAMNYGDGPAQRWSYARALTLALGRLAHAQADALGVLAGIDGAALPLALPPAPRHAAPARLQDTLEHVSPAGSCPWDELFAILPRPERRRGGLVVITDLLDPGADARASPTHAAAELLLRLAEYAALGPHVVVVQLLHPDELEFPWRSADQLQFECLRGRHLPVETHAAAARDEYLAALREHLDAVDAAASRVHIPLLRARTDAPMVETLARLLEALATGHAAPDARATVQEVTA